MGVDWAGLIADSKKMHMPGKSFQISARKHWQSHRILLDVGISVKLAGEEFAQQILTDSKMKLMEEIEELKMMKENSLQEERAFDNMKIKKEILDEDDIKAERAVKEEDEDVEEEEDLNALDKIEHPVAAIQIALRKKREHRRHLIMNATGQYSRALCARRDLQIRRHLCGYPIKELNDRPTDPIVNEQLKEMAVKLFQNAMQQKEIKAI